MSDKGLSWNEVAGGSQSAGVPTSSTPAPAAPGGLSWDQVQSGASAGGGSTPAAPSGGVSGPSEPPTTETKDGSPISRYFKRANERADEVFEAAAKGVDTRTLKGAAIATGRLYKGTFEALLAQGTGIIGDVVGAAAGVATQDSQKGEKVASSVTYKPSETGQAVEGTLGAVELPVSEALTYPSRELYNRGHPLMGMTVQAGIDLLPLGLPKALQKVKMREAPKVEAAEESMTQQALKESLNEGSGDSGPRITTAEEAGASIRNATSVADETIKATRHLSNKDLPEITGDTKPGTAKHPGELIAQSHLAQRYDEALKIFNPEGLGPEAEKTGAIVASAISQQMRRDVIERNVLTDHVKFWDRNLPYADSFIEKYEAGKDQGSPVLNSMAKSTKEMNDMLAREDNARGLTYEPENNYIYHSFEPKNKFGQTIQEWAEEQYGTKWGEPGFMKDRVFKTYAEAVKAGFSPRYKNPAELMLARFHASNIAHMQLDVMDMLKNAGLATEKEGRAPFRGAQSWKAPDGKSYWIHPGSYAVMRNAFKSKSLWEMQGMVGDSFKALSEVKNKLVQVRLSLSLFHPLHVTHIDMADTWARTMNDVLSGKESPAGFIKNLSHGIPIFSSILDNNLRGRKAVRVWRGDVPLEKLSADDKLNMRYMSEGGFVPELAQQYRSHAKEQFGKAVRQQRPIAAIWNAPWAALEGLSDPFFKHWIPHLKTAAYLDHARSAIKRDPSLLTNDMKRRVVLRRISKSIDNRYGEMSYNTLFWPKMVKDVGVLNTLSLGWNLGFLREYGGAVAQGSRLARIKPTEIDKLLFGSVYLTTAATIGGLMTYGLSGTPPQTLEDLIYPRTGEQGPDGRPVRVNTMFYTREFGGITKHIENEGLVPGLTDLARSKSSGVLGLITEMATGLNQFNQEIRNPDSPAMSQVEQTIWSVLKESMPISVQKPGDTREDKVLNVLGFTSAPKYATESPIEGKIMADYSKYVKPSVTPYGKAERSHEYAELRKLYDADDDKFDDKLAEMADKYNMSGADIKRLRRELESDSDEYQRAFQQLPWQKQKVLLDRMSDDERDRFLPFSNKTHLRDKYGEDEE